MAASATGNEASHRGTSELMKTLGATHQVLRQQEQLACSLAKALTKLCAETEEHLTLCGTLQSMTSEEAEKASSNKASLYSGPVPDVINAAECESSNSNGCKLVSIKDPEQDTLGDNRDCHPVLPGAVGGETDGNGSLKASNGRLSAETPASVFSDEPAANSVWAQTPRSRRRMLFRQESVMRSRLSEYANRLSLVHSDCIFADAEKYKQEIRKKLIEEPYDPCKLFKKTGLAQKIARTTAFEVASMVLLIISSIWISISMDNIESVVLHKSPVFFQVVTHLFCLCFLVEVLVRIFAFEFLRYALRDFWCCFDTVLVILFISETWILGTVSAISGIDFTRDRLKTVVAFRVLRLLRLMRVLRLVRLLRHVPQLMVIVRGLGMAIRSVACVLALLLLFIYAGGIVGRGMFEGSAFGQEWFPSVLASMGTLMLECTLSGSRGTVLIRQAHAEHPIYALVLVLFVLLNMTMMGILAGILVQTVRTVAEVEREEKTVRDLGKTIESLWAIVLEHDSDSDGKISVAEFQVLVSLDDTARIMRAMDVDVEGLLNLSGFIFDQHKGRMDSETFLKMVLDLRANKKATVKDHMETRKFLHSEVQTLSRHQMETRKLLRSEVQTLSKHLA